VSKQKNNKTKDEPDFMDNILNLFAKFYGFKDWYDLFKLYTIGGAIVFTSVGTQLLASGKFLFGTLTFSGGVYALILAIRRGVI